MSNFIAEIETLAKKSAKESSSADALRFSQAALNLANTAQTQVFTLINKKEIPNQI